MGASAAYVPFNTEVYTSDTQGPEYLPHTTLDDRRDSIHMERDMLVHLD